MKFKRGNLSAYLWGFHGIVLREVHLELVGFICIESPWSSNYFNNPSCLIKQKIKNAINVTTSFLSI